MSVSVFVMTHKRYDEPKDSIYKSLQVGRATGDPSLPYIGDDTGINISDQNCYWGELTGLYWIWKNYHEDDIIGICHYRRFYINKDGSLYSGDDFERLLKMYDCIVSDANVTSRSVRDVIAADQNIEDIYACGRAIERFYPDDVRAFNAVLDSYSTHYSNLMVCRHEDFDAYCEWLFAILNEAAKEIDVSGYDNYRKRVFGFLSEILMNVWIRARGFKAYPAIIGITGEKVETAELKSTLASFVREGRYTDARKYFYDFTERRPDVRLPLSDISGEIPKIEMIMYILEEEKKANVRGMATVSSELKELIAHFDKIVDILKALSRGNGTEEQVQYLLSKNVSAIAVEVIIRNVSGIEPELIRNILGI